MREKLKDLVVAAVRLAIVRHDLVSIVNDEAEECPGLTDADAQAIAQDTWDAMNGIGTCDAEAAEELRAILGEVYSS